MKTWFSRLTFDAGTITGSRNKTRSTLISGETIHDNTLKAFTGVICQGSFPRLALVLLGIILFVILLSV